MVVGYENDKSFMQHARYYHGSKIKLCMALISEPPPRCTPVSHGGQNFLARFPMKRTLAVLRAIAALQDQVRDQRHQELSQMVEGSQPSFLTQTDGSEIAFPSVLFPTPSLCL